MCAFESVLNRNILCVCFNLEQVCEIRVEQMFVEGCGMNSLSALFMWRSGIGATPIVSARINLFTRVRYVCSCMCGIVGACTHVQANG